MTTLERLPPDIMTSQQHVVPGDGQEAWTRREYVRAQFTRELGFLLSYLVHDGQAHPIKTDFQYMADTMLQNVLNLGIVAPNPSEIEALAPPFLTGITIGFPRHARRIARWSEIADRTFAGYIKNADTLESLRTQAGRKLLLMGSLVRGILAQPIAENHSVDELVEQIRQQHLPVEKYAPVVIAPVLMLARSIQQPEENIQVQAMFIRMPQTKTWQKSTRVIDRNLPNLG